MSRCRGRLWEYLPWLAVLVYLVYIHRHLGFTGDDLLFAKYEAGMDFWSWRYATWSSRLLTESILVTLLHLPVLVWRSGDILLPLAMLMAFSYLLVPKQDKVAGNSLLAISFILYPFDCMSSAGNVATTLNYLWPMSFCILSLLPFKRMLEGEPVPPQLACAGVFFLILADDVEQCCMILLMLAGGLAVFYREKALELMGRYRTLLAVYFVVTLASLLKIALCPGNSVRYLMECARFFPDFERLSLVEKFHLFILDFSTYLCSHDVLVVLLSAVLLFLVVRRFRSAFLRLAAAVPLMLSLAMTAGQRLLHLWNADHVRQLLEVQHGIGVLTFGNLKLYALFAIGCLLLASLLYTLYLAFYGTRELRFVLLIYLTGVGTAAVLMFSPTIFASSYRVFLHFSMAAMVLLVHSALYAAGSKSGNA